MIFIWRVDAGGRMVLAREEPESGLRPAVSYLFRSLAETYGAAAVGVLLTGMGKDGAAELKLMKDHGALTIAQDRESSVVHGMPGEAIALGAATQVLPADKIAAALHRAGQAQSRRRENRSHEHSHATPDAASQILIAEDSATQAQRLQHILEQHGYRVTAAANGRLALEAAQRNKPALIISDVVMPEMNGYELCRRVKADARLADVPVILVTTLSDPQDVIRGLECRRGQFHTQALRRATSCCTVYSSCWSIARCAGANSRAWAWKSCSAARGTSSPRTGCRSSTCCCPRTKPPCSATRN